MNTERHVEIEVHLKLTLILDGIWGDFILSLLHLCFSVLVKFVCRIPFVVHMCYAVKQ